MCCLCVCLKNVCVCLCLCVCMCVYEQIRQLLPSPLPQGYVEASIGGFAIKEEAEVRGNSVHFDTHQ